VTRSPRTDAKFRRIYDEHFLAIRSYCLRRLPASEVNDAVAEVFVVLWRRIDDAPEGDDAPLWLYGVARNVVRNAHRSARRRTRLKGKLGPLHRTIEPDPEMLVVRRSADTAMLEALAELRQTDREILRLSFWEDLTNIEIATVLGIEPHAVTMRLGRARDRLARQLGMDQTKQATWADPRLVGQGGEQ